MGVLEIIRIKIIFHINRPHLTFDILSILKKYDVYIISMEVYSNIIYLKLPYISEDALKIIEKEWKEVYGFDYMEIVDIMAFEEKDIELKGVLNLLNEGVVMLSTKGVVEYFNNEALDALKGLEVGAEISKFIADSDLAEYIGGNGSIRSFNSFKDKKIDLETGTYLLSINDLYSEERIFCGFLLTLKEAVLGYSFDNYITFEDIIGEDENFIKITEAAKSFAYMDNPILLKGEVGTGKEMFARAIHAESDRASKPFVGINCATIPEELLESDLFGYESGGIEGVKGGSKRGIFDLTNGGTVFLDEIGEMNIHLQTKLLEVIRDKKLKPIGSDREIDLNVKIIAATSKDLERAIEEKKFRQDLYNRLNVFTLEIPSIRQRPRDFDIIIDHFLKVISNRYDRGNLKLSQEAKEKLKLYSWPGNIRELQSVLERAIVLSKSEEIKEEDIIFDSEAKDGVAKCSDLNSAVSAFERNFILKALRKNPSVRAAAKELNVTHTLLLNRIKKYEIEDEEWK